MPAKSKATSPRRPAKLPQPKPLSATFQRRLHSLLARNQEGVLEPNELRELESMVKTVQVADLKWLQTLATKKTARSKVAR